MDTSANIDEGVLIRRMRLARLRQWAIATTSVLAAALVVIFLKPNEIGDFAFYSITLLILLNAIFAVRHCVCVLYPIEALLRKLRAFERKLNAGELPTERFTVDSNDAFVCLALGFDAITAKLSDRIQTAADKARLNNAMLMAIPFTMYTVDPSGRVISTIKDHYQLINPLGLQPGKQPTLEIFGQTSLDEYHQVIKAGFANPNLRWFDLDVGTHHLRGTIQKIRSKTALIVLGDLPTIDQLVEKDSGKRNENGFTHRQNAMKYFAASIAHDGRNVFTALKNLIELNRDTNNPQLREQMTIAEETVVRGTKLMTELMQYAGETRYQLTTMPSEPAMHKLFDDPTLKALVPDTIKLEVDIANEPMPDLDLDIDQVWKISLNLVKNSIEAIGKSLGCIRLSAKPYTMTAEEAVTFRCVGTLTPGMGVMMVLADNGPGIEPAILNRLFDPYISSKGNGRGLGLATTLSVIEAHNGAIRVRSQCGHGTTFKIFLPASRHNQAELDIIREVAPNGEILLVDDDPTILRTTSLILKMLKLAAHPAANEADAMRKLRTLNTRLKAVLVDANLGRISSLGLINRIRAEQPTIPIILASGDDEATIQATFAGSPYDSFIQKPFTVNELSRIINETKVRA